MEQRTRLIVRLGWAALGLALLLLILAALYLAADAEGLGAGYARHYPYVFVIAALALLLLAGAIAARLLRLRRRLREGAPGARLSRRLLWVLLLLALPPVFLVYGFSVRFVAATVDTWLVANSGEAMEEALRVGRLYLDERKRGAEADAAGAAAQLDGRRDDELVAALEQALDASTAWQLAVFEADGRMRALAAADPRALAPAPPGEDARLTFATRGRYAEAEDEGSGLRLRILQPVVGGPRGRMLQGLYPLPEDYAARLARVEANVAAVRQANFLRDSLKLAFVLILSFVLLISVLLAMLLAFDVARRLVAPIGRLAAATRNVAEGRYDAPLPPAPDDELGFLVDSFNRMMRELDIASARARASAEETERQRAFLETVLARLSSGVLVVDAQGHLASANAAATGLLGGGLHAGLGQALAALADRDDDAATLMQVLDARSREGVREFREEIALGRGEARRLLLLRGARLPDGGLVAVFDDTTAIDRARRDAAWAEVARRLAHEVKNPLTPIQLAAERLRRRVLPRLDPAEADVVDRATHTIVAQVDALKTLVNAFGDYAQPPALRLLPLDLNALVSEVLDLYRGDPHDRIVSRLAADLPALPADAGRLRQVLHNLIKNAQEACAERAGATIEIGTALSADGRAVELWVADDGPGLPPGFDASWFEPYRSTKPKGTGLGLAIARKIAEEHGGRLDARNRSTGGARFSLRLPL